MALLVVTVRKIFFGLVVLALAALSLSALGVPVHQVAFAQDSGLTKFEQDRLERYRRGCQRGNQADCTYLRKLEKEARSKQQQAKERQQRDADGMAQCDAGDLEACWLLALTQEGSEQWGPKTPLTRERYSRTCPKENPLGKGCERYANYLTTGKGGPVDKPLALEVYLRGCSVDHAMSCASAAFMKNKPDGVPQDRLEAYRLYNKACELGLGGACSALATLGEKLGPEIMAPKGLDRYVQGCNAGRGDGYGCLEAAKIFADRQSPDFNLANAANHYSYACTRARAEGCYKAGQAYDEGLGVAVDDTRAFQLFDRGCTGFSRDPKDLLDLSRVGNLRTGDQRACARMSEMHLAGQGTPKDAEQARYQSKSACEQLRGVVICETAGDIHYRTLSLSNEDNRREIVALKTRACKARNGSEDDCWSGEVNSLIIQCKANDQRACNFVTGMFEDTKRDCDRRSATFRVINACFNTGHLYLNHKPIRDEDAAKRYFRRSCTGGNQAGCERLAKLGS